MGRICKECKAGSAGVPDFLESSQRPLVFLDAGWKPSLPLALPGVYHAPSLGVGEGAMQAKWHGRLDRVGCAWGNQTCSGRDALFPLDSPTLNHRR